MLPATGKLFDVFLSHSGADTSAAIQIAERLEKAGLTPWLDKWQLSGGGDWQPEIEEALLNRSSACAVFFGPAVDAKWREGEMRLAVQKKVESSGLFRVIPVLLPDADPKNVPPFVAQATWVDFRTGLKDENAFNQLVAGIRGELPPRMSPIAESPYPGLNSFDVGSRFFFGREELTRQAAAKLAQNAQSNCRFLAVVGCSGSGKSSLARAGVLSALKSGRTVGAAGSDNWPQVICRPGANPIESLAVALSKLPGVEDSPKGISDLMDLLQTKEQALHLTARRALRDDDPSRRLIIFVDQFEECFTICQNTKLREAFLNTLLEAAEVNGGQTVVLIALRIDFMGECTGVPRLRNAIQDRTILVGEIEDKELRTSIETPAWLNGREFEAGLVDVLIEEVRGQSGALPLLQFTLQQLWIESTGRYLTHAAYRKAGRVGSALGNKADELYAALDEKWRELCRRVFLRLVQNVGAGRYTRRRALLSELVIGNSTESDIHNLLTTLSAEKAWLVTMRNEAGGIYVEIAHEALIRSWKTLNGWLESDQIFQRFRIQLQNALEIWSEKGRDAGSLLRGGFLDEAARWRSSRAEDLNAPELEFVELSIKLRNKDLLKRRVLRWMAVPAAAIVVGLGVSIYYLNYESRVADSRQFAAESLRIGEPLKQPAVWLALQAVAAAPTREAYEALTRSVQAAGGSAFSFPCAPDQPCGLNALAFDPGAAILVSAGEDKSLRALNTASSTQKPLVGDGEIRSVAFDPSGQGLVIAGTVGIILLGPDLTARHAVFVGSTVAVSYLGTDGKQLVAALDDGRVCRFSTSGENQQCQELFHTGSAIRKLATSREGKWVAVADGEQALLWDVLKGGPGKSLTGAANGGAQVVDVAFDAAGTHLGTASTSGWLAVWNPETGRALFETPAHSEAMTALTYNQDGWLATASHDQTIRLWDEKGVEQTTLLGFTSPITALAFSKDGKVLAAGAADNTVRIFLLDHEQLRRRALELASRQPHPEGDQCLSYLGKPKCPALPWSIPAR